MGWFNFEIECFIPLPVTLLYSLFTYRSFSFESNIELSAKFDTTKKLIT